MKTSYEDLERNYDNPDPWGYKTNPADIERKRIILEVLNEFGPFERALDIGCGEGWISTDIPAKEIYGYEASEQATARFPSNVIDISNFPATVLKKPSFDLVMVTGALYRNYEWEKIVNIVNAVGTKYILTSHILSREHSTAITMIDGRFVHSMTFPYIRSETEKFQQRLRVWKRGA